LFPVPDAVCCPLAVDGGGAAAPFAVLLLLSSWANELYEKTSVLKKIRDLALAFFIFYLEIHRLVVL
jgi:hypothetical protein